MGTRRSEVKKEVRAQRGPGDTSEGGYPSPPIRGAAAEVFDLAYRNGAPTPNRASRCAAQRLAG